MGITFNVLCEFGLKGETAALRGAAEKQIMTGLGKMSRLNCTRARYAELLPMLLELFEHDDIAVASSAAAHLTRPLVSSGAACAPCSAPPPAPRMSPRRARAKGPEAEG